MSPNTLHYFIPKEHNLDSKSNHLDYCSPVGPVMSLSVAFISFAKKVAIDFCQFFSHLLRILFSLNL